MIANEIAGEINLIRLMQSRDQISDLRNVKGHHVQHALHQISRLDGLSSTVYQLAETHSQVIVLKVEVASALLVFNNVVDEQVDHSVVTFF